jgi:hypothetical protein
MKLKMKQMTLAVAGAIGAGMASQALALNPSVYTTANTVDIYMSGASAQDPGIRALMRRLCVAGTLDHFTDTNQQLFFCQANTTQTGALGKPNIAVRKTSVGGSGNGVQPVANSTPLQFFNISALAVSTTGCGPTSSVTAFTSLTDTIGLPAYTTRSCPIASFSSNVAPDIGFSDVEPALLGATPAEVANLDAASANAVIFGTPVTLKLRNALQAAQGLTVGDESLAQMPSLTKAQIASIQSGLLTNWSSLANSSNAPLVNTSATAGADSIFVVRRVNTSGTQTFAQAHFLGQGCAVGVATFLTANDTAANNLGLTCGGNVANTVYEGSGGGDLRNCLIAHDTAGRWAIGILSTEDASPTATSNSWRHIKIDGVAPTQLNVFNGKYTYWSEQTVQWRKTTNALAGAQLTFANAVRTKLGDPFVISQVNLTAVHSWGKAGLMALPLNGGVPPNPTAGAVTETILSDNPVGTFARAPTGNINNCQPPVQIYPTSVAP